MLVLLLLAIYRSPLVALVPLFVVGIAYVVAGGLTYMLVRAGVTTVSGQTTAILIVLMFGAGTDYCLLIVARFRDELRRTARRRRGDGARPPSAPARRSSRAGAIVIVAMLVLALADFNATREMGPILALGIAVMVVAGLTLLPAILGTLGRRAFWPAVPQVEVEPRRRRRRSGRRVGRLVGAHPAATAAAVTLILVVGALGALGGREPLDFSEAFRTPPESVAGRAADLGPLHPGSRGPASTSSRRTPNADAVICEADRPGLRTPVQEMYLSGRLGSPERPGIRTRPGPGLSEDESFLG